MVGGITVKGRFAVSDATIKRYCKQCEAYRMFIRPRPNHILHLLLSVFTVGLWLPIWLLIGFLTVLKPFRCPVCTSNKFM